MALSYAAPDRTYAEALASRLADAGLNVFFDLFEQAVIVGKHLFTFLDDVYQNKARYCVVLISTHYAKRVWTKHEIQAAFNRAVREKREYILPVRLDDTKIKGLSPDLAYIDAQVHSVEAVARVLIDKITKHARRRRAGRVAIHFDRRSILRQIPAHLREEQRSITILTRGGYTASSPEFVSAINEAYSSSPSLRVRFILPGRTWAATRAASELRSPETLEQEVRYAAHRIREHVPFAQLRLLHDIPSYSAVCLSSAAWYMPQLHTRGVMAFPVFALTARSDPELFDWVVDDLDRVWSFATETQ